MIGSVVLVGLLAMAPNWAIVDIPYPDSSGGSAAHAPTPEARVTEALQDYARARSATLRKGDITELKVEGAHATARLHVGQRAEVVHLEYANHEWKVVRVE